MRYKFKSILLILCVLFLSACLGNMKPSEKTEEFLNRYIKNDQSLISELDGYLNKQNLSNEQRAKYKDIILDEYATIKYSIKDEVIEGDKAKVEVLIEVKDLYKASKVAEEELVENPENFYTDNKYDKDKFVDFKLEEMKTTAEKKSYTIFIELSKKDGIWNIDELSSETLEKIHGIYDYETSEEES